MATNTKPTQVQLKGYKVTVEGQYRAIGSDGKKGIKPYKFEVVLPVLDRALSIVKHKVLPKLLRMQDQTFTRYRTIYITNVETPDGMSIPLEKKFIRLMNRQQLTAFIESNGLPINVDSYGTLDEIRQAIQDAMDNPDRYAQKAILKKADTDLDKQLVALNPALASYSF